MEKESKAIPTEIYNKLFKVQKEIGTISKDKTNGFYKSQYFDINKLIEHVTPILEKHKLLLLQPIKDGEQYSVIIDLDGGSVESSLRLPTDLDAQKIGSAITYYRRYTLQSLLALQSEDDDGNNASSNYKKGTNEGNVSSFDSDLGV